MAILPWRVRNAISEHFPLGYHLATNLFRRVRSGEYWDRRLEESWDERGWPTKGGIIASLTGPDDVLIDIACGTGSILRDLKARGYRRLHGLEISRYAVNRLAAEGITMHHGSIPELPLPDAFYDVVIASQVLEHVIRRNRFMREIVRVLKPGGTAFIFVPNDCLGPIDEPEHVIKYDEASFRHFLGRHFASVEVQVIKDAQHEMTILFGLARSAPAGAPDA